MERTFLRTEKFEIHISTCWISQKPRHLLRGSVSPELPCAPLLLKPLPASPAFNTHKTKPTWNYFKLKPHHFFPLVYRTKHSRKLLDTLSRCSLSLQLLVFLLKLQLRVQGRRKCLLSLLQKNFFYPSISFPRGWLQSREWQIFMECLPELPLIVPACWGDGR